MSRNESERGTIKIPRGEWSKLKKTLMEANNAEQERIYETATRVKDAVLAAGKGKRGFDWRRAVEDSIERERCSDDRCHAIRDLLWPRNPNGSREEGKPSTPKKKDLQLANRKTTSYEADLAKITLDDESHSVTWDVSENNHACESSRASAMGKVFFKALDAITWTRGSGGKIIGNDEYNRDNNNEGGGGNYATSEYGPHVKKPVRSSFSYGRY